MRITLKQAAEWVNATASLGYEENEFCGVSTDTRTITEGQLFVALRGDTFNGHNFIDKAFAAGASAVMVEDGSLLKERPGLVVEDTLKALGDLAHQYRWQGHLMPWIAVTGSNGKSTTRRMIAHVLEKKGKVCEPEANFNNLIGLPLTILKATEDCDYGVVELGTNQPGEISRLTEISTPTVAIITNIAPAHLERLSSPEGIAREKACIFERLPHDGLAIYPSQSEYSHLLKESIKGCSTATFALEAYADLTASEISTSSKGSTFKADGVTVCLPLLGRHNIGNCLAAMLALKHLGVSFKESAEALEDFKTIKGRLELIDTPHCTIINDSYNANPESLRAAIRSLLEFEENRKVAIIGDMKELGENASKFHSEMGKWLSKLNVDVILAVGKESLHIAENAHGQNARQIIRHFRSVQSMIGHLRELIQEGDVVLVKGSRGMKLERVVSSLKLIESKI